MFSINFSRYLHDCAMMDASILGSSNSTCIPWEVDYNTGTANLENLVETCTQKNLNMENPECATSSCIIEGYFITNVFQLFISGSSQHNLSYLHSNGFNVELNCPSKFGPVSEKSCCGPYPFRYPYKTYGGDRACCGMKTYDANLLTCCDDESIKLICP